MDLITQKVMSDAVIEQLVDENAEYRRCLELLYEWHKKNDAAPYIMMAIKEVLEGKSRFCQAVKG